MTHPEALDAITGEFVTLEYAALNKDTTVVEQVPDANPDENCGVVPVVIPSATASDD